MKNTFIFMCKLIIFFLTLETAAAQNINLNIELDKKEFIEGESVYLLMSLNNSSSQILNYDRFYLEGRTLELNVTDERGYILPYKGADVDYALSGPTVYTLQPGKSTQYLCPLSYFYHNFVEKDAIFPFPVVSRLLPGLYKVKAQYQVSEGKIYSNELTFTVSAPKNDDAILFERLKTKFTPDFIWGKRKDEAFILFDTLSKSNSQSIYLPIVKKTLSGFYFQKGDTSKAIEILKDLIKKNPNSGYALEAFQTMKISNREKELFLNEFKSINPSSRIVKFGDSILNKKVK